MSDACAGTQDSDRQSIFGLFSLRKTTTGVMVSIVLQIDV